MEDFEVEHAFPALGRRTMLLNARRFPPDEKGRDLLKQVRTHLIETAKPLLQALVQEITGVKVVSLHHDLSIVTGEAFVVLTLAEPPSYRPAKNK